MGQRDGFARSDLDKINQMYKCDNPSGPTFPWQKPNRPSAVNESGSGGFTNPFAQVVSGIGNIFSAMGKREAIDIEATSDLN